ncbi:MAG: hypothetical protein V1867_06365 [Candidatus Falkowbacteria bacterium]
MNEKQSNKMMGILVEHQSEFSGLTSPEGQWVIRNPKLAIALFVEVIRNQPKPIERIRVINETTIMVNLDAPSNPLLNGAKIEFQIGSSWVKVEKRSDGLYVDDRRVTLHLSERQKGKKDLPGYELQKELEGKPTLHPNIMDALFENPYLIPEDWKKDEKGNILYIFFWAVVFRSDFGSRYVRYFSFNGGWNRNHCSLEEGWNLSDPAALLAS